LLPKRKEVLVAHVVNPESVTRYHGNDYRHHQAFQVNRIAYLNTLGTGRGVWRKQKGIKCFVRKIKLLKLPSFFEVVFYVVKLIP
jgi:hypothetical protein